MSAADASAEVRARLESLIASGPRRRAVTEAARDMLDRLDAPVRVVIYGLPGAGRTRLVNLLLGRDLLPPGVPLPTLALRHGAEAKCSVILPDGKTRYFQGLPVAEIGAVAPLLIEAELPDPVLARRAISRIAADASPADQAAAMAWAAPRTDIALWASARFDAAEAAIWAAAPDSLKDNAYLVLTGGVPAEARGEFRGTVSVEGGDASGLEAALESCEARGRQALCDHALLFLSRYDRAGLRAVPDAPAPPTGSSPPPSRPLTRPRLVAETAAPQPAPPPAVEPAPTAAVIALLRERARELNAALPRLGERRDSSIFDHCLETVSLLVERFGSGPDRVPSIEDLILDVADHITLLEAESGRAQATESLTLLLQLRRDLEMRSAA